MNGSAPWGEKETIWRVWAMDLKLSQITNTYLELNCPVCLAKRFSSVYNIVWMLKNNSLCYSILSVIENFLISQIYSGNNIHVFIVFSVYIFLLKIHT